MYFEAEKRPAGTFGADQFVFELEKRPAFIFSRKIVPQGRFGQMKLYFEPEKRPAGAFWADKISNLSQQVVPQGTF